MFTQKQPARYGKAGGNLPPVIPVDVPTGQPFIKYQLTDVVATYPGTQRPPDKVLADITLGDNVKLIISCHDGTAPEHLWVRVTRRDQNHFTGKLESVPSYNPRISRWCEIRFEVRHIFACEPFFDVDEDW